MFSNNPQKPKTDLASAIRRQRGFNTIEILIGMSILLLIVAVVGAYFRYNMKTARRSDSFFVSTELASTSLEVSKRRLSNPDTAKTLLALVEKGDYTTGRTETVQGKEYQVTVRYRKLSAAGNLMMVRATVTWDGGRTNTLGTAVPCVP